MFENVCSMPFSADVLCMAIHPTESRIIVGLATGHVECFQLPAKAGSSPSENDDDDDGDEEDGGNTSIMSNGKGTIETLWRTKRHKGACRCLTYSLDGQAAYSAGSDGIIKHFSPSTGQVVSKMAIPFARKDIDPPATILYLNPRKLILACDSGAVHIIDLQEDGVLSEKPARTVFPHTDYASAMVPLPPSVASTSGHPKQWISTGGTTLAVIDARAGIVTRSEDQEDELLCAVFVPGLGPKNNRNNGVVAIGTGSGVVTVWDRGAWDDQQERVIVDSSRGGGESIDALSLFPESLGLGGKKVVVVAGDGILRGIDLSRREIIDDMVLLHDDLESVVVAVGFDPEDRLISAGGPTVKVWQLKQAADRKGAAAAASRKRAAADSDDSDDEQDSDDDSDDPSEDEPRRPAKRRKGKGKAGKTKKLDEYGHHGILTFDGLE